MSRDELRPVVVHPMAADHRRDAPVVPVALYDHELLGRVDLAVAELRLRRGAHRAPGSRPTSSPRRAASDCSFSVSFSRGSAAALASTSHACVAMAPSGDADHGGEHPGVRPGRCWVRGRFRREKRAVPGAAPATRVRRPSRVAAARVRTRCDRGDASRAAPAAPGPRSSPLNHHSRVAEAAARGRVGGYDPPSWPVSNCRSARPRPRREVVPVLPGYRGRARRRSTPLNSRPLDEERHGSTRRLSLAASSRRR